MSEQEEEHVMEIKAEEVIQKEDDPEEEEEEENEQQNENNNQQENKNKPEEEEEDGEGEGEEGGEIQIHVDDPNQPQNDERTTFDITLSNDLKINVEWFIDDGNVDILFKTD
jgi:hypothetical protein